MYQQTESNTLYQCVYTTLDKNCVDFYSNPFDELLSRSRRQVLLA